MANSLWWVAVCDHFRWDHLDIYSWLAWLSQRVDPAIAISHVTKSKLRENVEQLLMKRWISQLLTNIYGNQLLATDCHNAKQVKVGSIRQQAQSS